MMDSEFRSFLLKSYVESLSRLEKEEVSLMLTTLLAEVSVWEVF